MSAITKIINLREANEQAVELEDEGHTIERFTDYHWRIDGRIDVWPSSKKFMRNGMVRLYKRLPDIFKQNL